MLRFISGETDPLIERVRFRTDHVAPHGQAAEAARAGPFFHGFDELAADAVISRVLRDDETLNLADFADGEDFLFAALDPSNDRAGDLGDEDNVRFPREDAVQSFGHDFGAEWVPERST